MKNKRNYRLPAFLLAAVMIIAMIPTLSLGEGSNSAKTGGTLTYEAKDARIDYASGGKTVSGPSEMNPNKTNTITVHVPDNDNLPQRQNDLIKVAIPDDVVITTTSGNEAACQSEDVRCTVDTNSNMLVFQWKNAAKPGFTAVITVTPDAPATREDVSGNRVLVVKNNHVPDKQLIVVKPTINVIDNTNRLSAVQGELIDGCIYKSQEEMPIWRFEHKSGDWYSISINGQYLHYGNNGNHMSFSSEPQYFLYTSVAAGNQFAGYADNGTAYYLNNKSNNVTKGVQASTWDDQSVELHKPLTTEANEALVIFNTNGGTADSSLKPIKTEKGETIILPSYNGTKKDNEFVGWATVNTVKDPNCPRIYQPGEEFEVEESKVTIYAAWSSTIPEKATFGIRLDGDIPDEPAQYKEGSYSKNKIEKNGAVKKKVWTVATHETGTIEGNHLVNSVTKNLIYLPTDEEIQSIYPAYNPETMYVNWYVQKWSSSKWKVDGVVVPRQHHESMIRYSSNTSIDQKAEVTNIPASYQKSDGSIIKIGATAAGKQMEPTRSGYIFKGWNTSADGTGTSYQQKADYTVNGDVTFYAQWEKIPTYKVSYNMNKIGDMTLPETMKYEANTTVTLAEAEEKEGYFFSGWMINGKKIEGSTFKMPAEDLEIQGIYYGPITVRIQSDWPDDREGYSGAKVKLTAILSGPEGYDYTLQWQYLNSAGGWSNYGSEQHGTEITYVLNGETSGRIWRAIVTNVQPKQE